MSAVINHALPPTPNDGDRPDRHPLSEVTPTPALHLVAGQPVVDVAAASSAVADLLTALGQDPRSKHLIDTPRRVADALAELLTPEPFAFTTFPNDEAYHGLVLVRDIDFTSLCEHHLLAFCGVAHIGYLPDKRIVGLSKGSGCRTGSRASVHVAARCPSQRVANCHLGPARVGS